MKKIYFSFVFSVLISFAVSAQSTYKDVAGIFYKRCTSCHHANGGAPFPMMNYSETYPYAASIQADVYTNKMPPWPPDTNYTRLLHERVLTQSERDAIFAWINDGAQQGDTTLAPPAPVYPKYHLTGTPDLILKVPGFASNATTADAYNCFAIPTGLSANRFIRAFEIVPNNPNIVHHVVVKIDTTGTVTSNTGGACFTEPGQMDIGGWAPGSPPSVYPGQGSLKLGMLLKAGSKIILQQHYPKGSAGQIDSTEIRLYFYPSGVPGIRNIYSTTFLQSWNWSVPANTVKPLATTYTPPIDISIFASSPHSHHLCTDMLVYAYKTSPADTIPLIHIPHWNFAWQGMYVHPHPVKVPFGYKMYSKHIFDNTVNNPDNPNNPPKTVMAGTSTTDEMLFDSFEWMPYQAGDENLDIAGLLSADTLLSSSVIEHSGGFPMIDSYVYPNPVNESATLVVMNERSANCTIKFFDICGKEVAPEITRNSDSFSIRRGNLSPGIYFYKLNTTKFSGSGKIIFTHE